MNPDLTNLLPPERQRALVRDYFLRLGVVIALMLSGLAIASALLLLPTYVFLLQSASAKETRLASLESTLSSEDEKQISDRLTALTARAKVLTALADAPSASKTISSLLIIPRPGITIASLTYAPPNKKIPGTIQVMGTAATRDALRNYQLALQDAPFVHAATLPVSAFAKDTDIDFSIAITLNP